MLGGDIKMDWIACLWEIFKYAVIPVLVAVFSVYVAEYFAKKRDYKLKKVELQIEYLQKEIEYLAKIENEIFTVSRDAINYLGRTNPDEKEKKYNEVIGGLSRINEQNMTLYYMFQCFNESMSIGIDIEACKKDIGSHTDRIKKICDNVYTNELRSINYEDEINKEVLGVVNKIQDTTKFITKTMTLAIDNIGQRK
jgi:hypothetical protein